MSYLKTTINVDLLVSALVVNVNSNCVRILSTLNPMVLHCDMMWCFAILLYVRYEILQYVSTDV